MIVLRGEASANRSSKTFGNLAVVTVFSFLLLTSSLTEGREYREEEKKERSNGFLNSWAPAIVGGCLAVFAAPAAIAAAGFTAAGITAGSIGTSMMAAMGPTTAGGIVATLQSAGVVGLTATGTAAVAGTGAIVGEAARRVVRDISQNSKDD